MKKQFKIYNGDATVEYDDNNIVKEEILDRIIKWCEDMDLSSGDMLYADVECRHLLPDLVSEIIDDILKFKIVKND